MFSSITFALAVLPEMHEKAVFDVMVFPFASPGIWAKKAGPQLHI